MDSEIAKWPGIADGQTSAPSGDVVDGESVTTEHDPAILPMPPGELADEESGLSILRANDALLSRLSMEEAIRLDEFLSRCPDSAFPNIESLDGMLTAVAISPEWNYVGGCLDEVCAELMDCEYPCFRTASEQIDFRILALRYLQNLRQHLDDTNRKYEPVLQDTDTRGIDWASGFMYQCDPDALYWKSLFRIDDKIFNNFLTIYELAYKVDLDRTQPEPDRGIPLSLERRKCKIQNIGMTVEQFDSYGEMAILLYRQELVERAISKQVEAKRTVGRNSPCPCGSGKKFKRCCGQ